MIKMPEPVAHGWVGQDGFMRDLIAPDTHAVIEGQYTTPLYTADALRDVLEQAKRLAFSAQCHAGDEFGHGYNKAAAEISRAIEKLQEQIK